LDIEVSAVGGIQKRSFLATFTTLWGGFAARIFSEDKSGKVSILLAGRRILTRPFKSKEKEKRKKARSFPNVQKIVAQLPHISGPMSNFPSLLKRSVKLKKIRLRFRFGLGDPSQTGIVYGLLQPVIAYVTPMADRMVVEVEPVFNEETLEGSLELDLRLRLFRLVVPAMKLILSKPVRQMRG